MTNLELLEATVQKVISANGNISYRGCILNCYLPGSFLFGLCNDLVLKYGPFINSHNPKEGFMLKTLVLAGGTQLNLIEDNSRFHVELIKK